MRRLGAAAAILTTVAVVNAGESMIVAHRGASQDAPENTIAAFRLAWEQGADAIEGDFHLTKDGQIVCFHDGDTERVSNTNLVVRESSLAELRKLDVGVKHGEAFKGAQIPTFAEVVETIPDGKKIYIEIKCGPEIIPALLEALKASGLQREQVVVICFKAAVLAELKTKAPEYAVSWLCRFKKEKESEEITPTAEQVLATLKRIKSDGLSSTIQIPEDVRKRVVASGYQWHVWTLNELPQAQRAQQLGAASITTDVPEVIREGLGG